ncbi:MAG: NADH-ubiquinone oxidoreductase-F iron-sulfur binding region domain-containing protein [Haloarculaceae archaeon]
MTPVTGAVDRSPVVRVSAAPGTGRDDRVWDAARDAATDVPVVRTGPTGIAELEPLVAVTRDEQTAYFYAPRPSAVRDAVAALEDGALPTDDADAVVEHDPGRATLPTPGEGPLAVGRRRVLGPCGWVDPLAPGDHEFVSADRDAGAVADVGLLGRGRGDASEDEPVADAWATARATDGDPVVVVNANEADDRPRGDRTLLAGAPMAVLDGLAAIAEYVDAEDAVVFLNESDAALADRVRRAVDAADDLPIVPQVVAGPDEYRAGEPTAAIEAMEGADRIEPRVQPPTPAEYGLHGRPTVVHTPRTVAQVQYALARPEAFDPDDADPGTRLVTVTGDVDAPATVELPSGGSLAAAREAVSMAAPFKMAVVGGILGGVTTDLDVNPTGPSLEAADLGTDGVVELFGADRCVVATAGERAQFAAAENSGRCVPGREGTKQLAELLRDVYDGSLRAEDIRELGRVMARTSNCQLGAEAPRPVTTAMDEFEPEFRAHADGRCPSGTCTEEP